MHLTLCCLDTGMPWTTEWVTEENPTWHVQMETKMLQTETDQHNVDILHPDQSSHSSDKLNQQMHYLW